MNLTTFNLIYKLEQALKSLENDFFIQVKPAKDPFRIYINAMEKWKEPEIQITKDFQIREERQERLACGMTIGKMEVDRFPGETLAKIVEDFVRTEIHKKRNTGNCSLCGKEDLLTTVKTLKEEHKKFEFKRPEFLGINPRDAERILTLYEDRKICWSCFDKEKQRQDQKLQKIDHQNILQGNIHEEDFQLRAEVALQKLKRRFQKPQK